LTSLLQARRIGLEDELSKIAVDTDAIAAALTIGAVAAGTGISTYDFSKYLSGVGAGKKFDEIMTSAKYKKVDSKEFVKTMDPSITVATTVPDIEAMLHKAFPEINKRLVPDTAEAIYREIITNNNACAIVKEKGAYVIAPPKCVPEVLGHEVGHVLDFREKGVAEGKPNPYRGNILGRIVQLFSKGAYHKKGQYAAEVNAWNKVPDSPTKQEIQDAALKTYEAGFHGRRLSVIAPVTALATPAAIGGADYMANKWRRISKGESR